MAEEIPEKALEIMRERFGSDSLIAVATIEEDRPSVRTVNSYYENGAFYVITHALSGKMKQIASNPNAAICGDWFTAHRNRGKHRACPRWKKRSDCVETSGGVFRMVYKRAYQRKRSDTCILRIRLTDGVLLSHGVRYDMDFSTDALN